MTVQAGQIQYFQEGDLFPPFEAVIVYNALVLANRAAIRPKMFPTADNAIQLEYEFNDRYLEIEVTTDGYTVYHSEKGLDSVMVGQTLEVVLETICDFHRENQL